jgi:transposase
VRDQLIGRRTQLTNAMRGYAAEFGLVAARGLDKIEPLLARIAADQTVPELVKELFAELGGEYAQLNARIGKLEARLLAWHRSNELSRRLAEIPCIGPIGAASLVMKVPDPHAFRCARDFAAWLGLTPKDHSTAGRQRMGVITRAGDEDLRRLLVVGATAVIRQASKGRGQPFPWLTALIRRKPAKLVAVALANKVARIVWKLMVSGERYNQRRALATRAEHSAAPPRGLAARAMSAQAA